MTDANAALVRDRYDVIRYVGCGQDKHFRNLESQIPDYLHCYISKGGRQIVVKLPFLNALNETDFKTIADALDHPLLDTLDFNGPKWAYLTKISDSDWRLIQKPHPLHRIEITPWLPIISEEEIDVHGWRSEELVFGKWGLQEVDVLIAVDDFRMFVVEHVMLALVEIKESGIEVEDVCFAPLAHVVRDGNIVGIVFEQTNGRMVDKTDRALVMEFFWRLRQHELAWIPRWDSHHLLDDLESTFFDANLYRLLLVDNRGKVRFDYQGVRDVGRWTKALQLEPDLKDEFLPNERAISAAFQRLDWEGINTVLPRHLRHHEPLLLVPGVSPRVFPDTFGESFCRCKIETAYESLSVARIETEGCPKHGTAKKTLHLKRGSNASPSSSQPKASLPIRYPTTSPPFSTRSQPVASRSGRIGFMPYEGMLKSFTARTSLRVAEESSDCHFEELDDAEL
ncbi:hypothetical protein V5O48_008572 [Marasmius crinis-equi]|uniref:Uncharacterized protein n=1 Tax=Marasmius crinis-equi TaxID=585013 RepID=A0ABR3FDK1_9AGAR